MKSGDGLGLEVLPKILGSPMIFMQRLGLATSNLARSCGLRRPIVKSHAKEMVSVAQGWGAPQNLGVPLEYLHNG